MMKFKVLVVLINLVILSLWRSIHKIKVYLKFFGYFANAQYDNMDFSPFCKRLKMTSGVDFSLRSK